MGNSDWKDLSYQKPDLAWDATNVAASLEKVNDYAEALAEGAIYWYYEKKKNKARWSRAFRYGGIFLTALAGLFPVLIVIWPDGLPWLQDLAPKNSNLLVSLFVGLAATLIAVDRFGGFSTAWIRYVRTAGEMQKLLHEYRLDWAKLAAEAGGDLSTQAGNLLARTRDFVVAVQSLVIQETQAWATEFESNLAQMEKSAKDQSDKQVQELQAKLEGAQPGSLFVTVSNLLDLDGGKFKIALFSNREAIAEAAEQTGVWQRLGLNAGMYTAHLSAAIGGKAVSKALPVTIEAGKPKHENVVLGMASGAAA